MATSSISSKGGGLGGGGSNVHKVLLLMWKRAWSTSCKAVRVGVGGLTFTKSYS